MKNHNFAPSLINKSLCQTCKRPYIDHTCAADCESCGKVADCELSPENILMCAVCYQKELRALTRSAEEEIAKNGEERVKAANQVIAESQKIDESIRYNGDFYNARVKSIEELRNAVNVDDSIPSDEKQYRFSQLIQERFVKFRERLAQLKSEQEGIQVEQLIITRELNKLVPAFREEWRKEFAPNDINYQPAVKKIKVAVPKKVSPLERMVKALAVFKGISEDEARIQIEKGMS